MRACAGETNGAAAADAAAAAAERGAEATKGMKAAAGRSSYVPAEVLASVPDPGSHDCPLCRILLSNEQAHELPSIASCTRGVAAREELQMAFISLN
eukprot:scaffold314050_cov19-Tisochrysis_lutea.AAC.1